MRQNQNWYHPLPPTPTRGYGVSDPKAKILCMFSCPWKHALGNQTAPPSTRPTCPRWRPPRRTARWGPLNGCSAPPLSSWQPKSAEKTSCCSSSSEGHHPPSTAKGESVKMCVCVYVKCKRKYCEPMTGSGVSGRASDERVKRTSQFRQSVDTIRLYLFTSSKKLDLLKSSSDPIPLGLHKAPSLNTLYFPAAGGGGRWGGLSVSLISAVGAANSHSASGKNS